MTLLLGCDRVPLSTGLPTDVTCSSCHGTPSNFAPPPSLDEDLDPAELGVGAHQAHVGDNAIRLGLSCEECHLVPQAVGDPGHVDARPAEVTFGPLASDSGAQPTWDRATKSCSSVYCHGATLAGGASTTPTWTTIDGSQARCTSCHGAPPPAPHPQVIACFTCHPETVEQDGTIDVQGQLHLNGHLELGPKCDSCHGSDGNPAPPRDLTGHTSTTATGVGAHREHLRPAGWRAAIACGDCHVVPEKVEAAGHLDSAPPAELTFGARATTSGAQPRYERPRCENVYCHGSTLLPGGTLTAPVWTMVDGTQAACGTCHSLPPGGNHPNRADCETCHRGVMGPNRTFLAPELHINGHVDVSPSCDTCHGSGGSPAPPQDLAGNVATTARGVGAHRQHLASSTWHAVVACTECHRVPALVTDPGHRDSAPPAELTFGALAAHGGVTPAFDGTGCRNVYCHGATLSGGFNSEPTWTRVDGSQAACGACHSLPPRDGHPNRLDCSTCHGTVVDARNTFIAPELHINGELDFSATCDACHGGGGNPSPPRDTQGNAATSARGVGAHRQHLAPSSWHATVLCGECHQVPAVVNAPDHIDTTPPADLTFGPLASKGTSPTFDGARCQNVYCHGASLTGGRVAAPVWTQVDGTQSACGSCHAIPPAAPHPTVTLGTCGPCHPFNGMFATDPTTHINGLIEAQ